jgi:lipid A 3-O-deacylase
MKGFMFAPKFLAAAAAVLAMQSACADDTPLYDAVNVDIATGTRTQMVRIGGKINLSHKFFQSNGTHLGNYIETSFGMWRANRWHDVVGKSESLVDIGLTPVFRFQKDTMKGAYIELGIGYHLLSKIYNNDTYQLSTAFQFGDHVGIGYVFDNKWEFGAKVQHYSNAGIKQPNHGVNFITLKASRQF